MILKGQTHMKRILVIGGGSSGVGAAWRAALCGAEVMLAEPGSILGGTSTLGGVHCWEPGIASAHLNRRLFARMSARPGACGVGRAIHTLTPESHMGYNGLIDGLDYTQSLRQFDSPLRTARVHFEPMAMHQAMWAELRAAGVRIWTNTAAVGLSVKGGRIVAARLRDVVTNEEVDVDCDALIDCSGNAVMSRMAGVKTRFGEDAREVFHEPGAPEIARGKLNGVSLVFRTTPDRDAPLREAPEWAYDTAAKKWLERNQPVSFVTVYPCGDRCYNPLPIMEGDEYFALPPTERYQACMARVYLYWDWLKAERQEHAGFRLHSIAPRVGVRESWRVATLQTLTERQVRGRVIDLNSIALGDHALDMHGNESAGAAEIGGPFGIPLGSLIVPDYENLLVAGRCAGFSHIAASSCRLSRTMMDLGEAAGAAAVLSDGDVREINARQVRDALEFERYLEWTSSVYPMIGMEGDKAP